jgi:hypothetical protein
MNSQKNGRTKSKEGLMKCESHITCCKKDIAWNDWRTDFSRERLDNKGPGRPLKAMY